jgi:HTH-type transcriptional regulator/antitoxin HigA
MAKRKSKSGNYQIGNEKEYNAAMDKIDALMKKGEAGLTEIESEALRLLAVATQTYEKTIYSIPAPKTLEGLIELKMYERKLKQKELARLLGIGEPKLSQIMSKKRKPDVAFLKAAHEHLGIDGNVLLEFA